MTHIPTTFDFAASLGQEACLPALHIEGDSNADNGRASSPAITYFAGPGGLNVTIPADALSWTGFREWSLSEEFPASGLFTFTPEELIVDMSPEYFESHNCIKTEITAEIHRLTKRRRLGVVFSDRFLYTNEVAGVSTEPDATFVSNESFAQQRCRICRPERPGVAEELVGSPDWVLEIVSPTSRRKDEQLLRRGYYLAGVAEYWLINALGDEIDFQLLVRGSEGFVPVPPQDGWFHSPVFGAAFRLTREKNARGLWEYTLHIDD